MAQPQSGVLPEQKAHALFLTFLVAESEAAAMTVRRVAAAIPGLTDDLSRAHPEAGLVSAVGFGAALWDRLFPAARPAQLRPFHALDGKGGEVPATPADLFLHLRGDRHDLNFELACQITTQLGASVSLVEEIPGFRYLDSRDLTGFVDGTENPTGDDRARVAIVGEHDPGFAGGSYVAIQRYIHDLASWNQLSLPEQEQIIARTKADDVEFEAADKPLTSHVKRVSIKADGKSLEILRHSMPYGTTAEHGLYFVAYCNTPDNFDKMLESMIVGDADGNFDHLMRYSRAVTGASFFVPGRDWLASQGG